MRQPVKRKDGFPFRRAVLAALILLRAAAPAAGETYTVLIGISNYGPRMDLAPHEILVFPETDAQAIYTSLLSPVGLKVNPAYVRLLLGSEAKLDAIGSALEWLKNAREADTVIIYFSGHGHFENGAGYIVPWDADRSRLAATSYSMRRLDALLTSGIRARGRILFADACHSGALNQSVSQTEGLRQSILAAAEPVFKLVASAANQTAKEFRRREDRHTLFGQFLVHGMEGWADENCDGSVTARELAGYVETQVRQETQGTQQPSARIAGSLGGMVIARQSPPRCAAGSPPAFGSLRITLRNLSCDDPQLSAAILLDGRLAGTICRSEVLRLPGLRSGRHEVSVYHRASVPAERRVEITAGNGSDIEIELKPKPAPSGKYQALLKSAAELSGKGGAGNHRKAIQALVEGEKLAPEEAEVQHQIGLRHKLMKANPDARRRFEAALKLDPSYLPSRILLADLLLDDPSAGPSEAIRLLMQVRETLRNEARAGAVLSRAYQRAEVCSESLRWAAPASGWQGRDPDFQVEPLLEYGDSLLLCAKAMPPDSAESLDYSRKAAVQFRAAIERLKRFESGARDRVIYEIVPFYSKADPRNKEQHEALQADVWKGLCESETRAGNACEAIEACEKWRAKRPKIPDASYLMLINLVQGARKGVQCAAAKVSWEAACEAYQKLDPAALEPHDRSVAERLAALIRQHRSCEDRPNGRTARKAWRPPMGANLGLDSRHIGEMSCWRYPTTCPHALE
ncbi:MAG: caspase family protein [Bryobacteraceae bacterium]